MYKRTLYQRHSSFTFFSVAYGCHYYGPQYTFYRESGQLYIGGIKSHKYNENRCLADSGTGEVPGLYPCKEAFKNDMGIYWDFKQGGELRNRKTNRCAEIHHHALIIKECSGQRWEAKNVIKPF